MMNKNDYLSALDGVQVPEDLKNRVASIPLEKKPARKRSILKPVLAVAAAFAVIIGIAAAANSADWMMSKSESVSEDAGYSYGASQGYDSVNETAPEMKSASSQVDVSSRKIAKNINISLTVADIDKAAKSIDSELKSVAGYKQEEQQSFYDSSYSEMTLRVPAQKAEDFAAFVATLGKVSSKSMTSSDVTNEYIDIQSRITALEAQQKALLAILEKSGTVADTITVYNELSEVQANLESLKSQQKQLDSSVTYTSVTLHIYTVRSAPSQPGTFSQELKLGFFENLRSIGTFFYNLALFLLTSSPYLLIIAAVITAAVLIIKKRRKKMK